MIYQIKFTMKLIMVSFILALFSCNDKECDKEIPPCIEKLINELKSDPVRNPPGQVWEWDTDEGIYYYITSDCCDQWNYLYDDQCNIVCAPDGGISGMGDGKCLDIGDNIVKSLIWSDDRQ